LNDIAGHEARLLLGWSPGDTNWLLLTRLQPAAPLTPFQAGAVRSGQTINVDGMPANVDELFRATVIQSDNTALAGFPAGDVRFGFSGHSGSDTLIVRWNEQGIGYWQGTRILDRTVTNAFAESDSR
jgi:hypothetical protein